MLAASLARTLQDSCGTQAILGFHILACRLRSWKSGDLASSSETIFVLFGVCNTLIHFGQGLEHIHTHTHTYIHTYMHTYTHTYIHTYIHTCMPTCIHTCIHAYMHTCMHACIHAYMHTCIHANMQTCKHANIHTYRHDMHGQRFCLRLLLRDSCGILAEQRKNNPSNISI